MDFLIAMMTAAFVENAVFSRALVGERIWVSGRRLIQSVSFVGMVTLLTTILSVAVWGIHELPIPTAVRSFFDPLVILLLVILLYLVVYHLLRVAVSEERYCQITAMLPRAAFSAVTIGALLIIGTKQLSWLEAIGCGLGAGVGFAVAVFLIAWGDRRLRLSDLPKSFQGLPARLLYLGILSLAFYGLLGHPVVL